MDSKNIEKTVKKIQTISICTAMCCIFTLGLTVGLGTTTAIKSSANNVQTEEDLIKKDSILNQIVKYEKGVNPFEATSISKLSNLSFDKLEKLVGSGYVIYVVEKRENKNLPEPIEIKENKIVVSTYSNDGALVDAVNTVLKDN